MALGLKWFIPQISEELGLTPDALYSRQRELVRAGLLKHIGLRGPGSGVRLTPENVAILLIAVLASDNVSEIIRPTRKLANAKRKGRGSSLGGAATFKTALVNALSDQSINDQISSVTVHRQDGNSDFHLRNGVKSMRRLSGDKEIFREGILVSANIGLETLYLKLRSALEAKDKP